MSVEDGVHWVLVPATVPEEMKARHFIAMATCPHGGSEHYLVVGKVADLDGQVDALSAVHAAHMGCRCPHVELVVKEESDVARG
jgi:hypothetical protein